MDYTITFIVLCVEIQCLARFIFHYPVFTLLALETSIKIDSLSLLTAGNKMLSQTMFLMLRSIPGIVFPEESSQLRLTFEILLWATLSGVRFDHLLQFGSSHQFLVFPIES